MLQALKKHSLLAILAITNAYLISHPNIIGRLGIFMYHYDMLKTFPRALVTVVLSLGICLAITFLAELYSPRLWARLLPWAGLVLSLGILVQVYFKFSSGSYRLTGASFIFGMHLLPVLMLYVFAQYLWGIRAKKNN
jgi:hypothetical protein